MDQDPSPATTSRSTTFAVPRAGRGRSWRRPAAAASATCPWSSPSSAAAKRCAGSACSGSASGKGEAAVQAAEELHALAPDADSTRLLAVAHLACGDYAQALKLLVSES